MRQHKNMTAKDFMDLVNGAGWDHEHNIERFPYDEDSGCGGDAAGEVISTKDGITITCHRNSDGSYPQTIDIIQIEGVTFVDEEGDELPPFEVQDLVEEKLPESFTEPDFSR